MKFTLIALMALSLIGCGNNPQVSFKGAGESQVATLLPTVDAVNLEPLLILRQKGSETELPLDFGTLKTGEKITKDWEMVNVGTAPALKISIPKTIGIYKITNVDCKDSLDIKKLCNLTAEITGRDEKTENEIISIPYEGAEGKVFNLTKPLIAIVINPPVITPTPVGRLVLTPKNHPGGSILLQDVEVGQKSEIQLELRNVGDARVSKIKLPEVNAPYVLKSTNCPVALEKGEACDIFLEYSPVNPKQDNLNYRVQYNDDKNTDQIIVANSIRNVAAAKLEVVDSQINQDIYDMVNVRPETLSPFQEIRGIDVGTLRLNREITFPVLLNNLGGANAIVTEIKDFQGSVISFNRGPFPGKNGTCSNYIASGRCALDIKVKPSEVNKFSDLIEISYQDGRGNLRRLTLVLFGRVREEESSVQCKTIIARSSSEQSQVIRRLDGMSLYKLPYKTKAGTAELEVLFNNDSNNNLRMTRNNESIVAPSVKNAMIQFGFAIDKLDLQKYNSVRLELDILKVSTEGARFDTTEVLCLNENRACSGTYFIDSHFRSLNTRNYNMVGNYFSTELLRSSPESLTSLKALLAPRGLVAKGEAARTDNLFRLKKKLSLESLAGDLKNVSMPEGLNFILADDSTLLALPRLILESESGKCE